MRSRIVLRYSALLSRRSTTDCSRLASSAATALLVIQSTTAATSAASGCGRSFGGIEWLLRTSTISRHFPRALAWPKSVSRDSAVSENSPSGFSPPWHSMQWV